MNECFFFVISFCRSVELVLRCLRWNTARDARCKQPVCVITTKNALLDKQPPRPNEIKLTPHSSTTAEQSWNGLLLLRDHFGCWCMICACVYICVCVFMLMCVWVCVCVWLCECVRCETAFDALLSLLTNWFLIKCLNDCYTTRSPFCHSFAQKYTYVPACLFSGFGDSAYTHTHPRTCIVCSQSLTVYNSHRRNPYIYRMRSHPHGTYKHR